MASVLELVNEVLRRTGQTEVTTLTHAETPAKQALDFLSETYADCLHRLKINRIQKQSSFSTTSGTNSYTLASDANINTLLTDSVLETGSHTLLRPVDYTHPLHHGTEASGRPEVFYVLGNSLVLYPTPDAAYILTYQYLVKPEKLSEDNDTTALPMEWEPVLVLGTQARLERFLGEPDADETYLLYRDQLVQLKASASLKQHRMKGFYRGAQS